jgi:hypothetical protein
MTEYDYSPAAYERYLHTQNRVSNWVSQTKAHERQYSNPFVPSAFNGIEEESPRPQRSKSSGSTSSSATVTVRPPQRSKTLDSKDFKLATDTTARPSRSRSFSSSQDTRSKSRSPRSQYSNTHSRSHSYSHQQQPPYRSYSTPRPPMPDPIRSYSTPPSGRVVYKTYGADGRGGPVRLPPPRAGETYVIIPPSRHVELLSQKGSVPYPNSPRGHAQHGGVYGAKEPLLKRILGSIPWSNHGSHRGSSNGSSRGPRRRNSH